MIKAYFQCSWTAEYYLLAGGSSLWTFYDTAAVL